MMVCLVLVAPFHVKGNEMIVPEQIDACPAESGALRRLLQKQSVVAISKKQLSNWRNIGLDTAVDRLHLRQLYVEFFSGSLDEWSELLRILSDELSRARGKAWPALQSLHLTVENPHLPAKEMSQVCREWRAKHPKIRLALHLFAVHGYDHDVYSFVDAFSGCDTVIVLDQLLLVEEGNLPKSLSEFNHLRQRIPPLQTHGIEPWSPSILGVLNGSAQDARNFSSRVAFRWTEDYPNDWADVCHERIRSRQSLILANVPNEVVEQSNLHQFGLEIKRQWNDKICLLIDPSGEWDEREFEIDYWILVASGVCDVCPSFLSHFLTT
jgi:hypothetical protein